MRPHPDETSICITHIYPVDQSDRLLDGADDIDWLGWVGGHQQVLPHSGARASSTVPQQGLPEQQLFIKFHDQNFVKEEEEKAFAMSCNLSRLVLRWSPLVRGTQQNRTLSSQEVFDRSKNIATGETSPAITPYHTYHFCISTSLTFITSKLPSKDDFHH